MRTASVKNAQPDDFQHQALQHLVATANALKGVGPLQVKPLAQHVLLGNLQTGREA